MSSARFPLGASGAKRQSCMNLHDCRDVGAKDALMEFVLQTFESIAEKKQGPVQLPVVFVDFSLNLDLRGNLRIILPIFCISIFVGISLDSVLFWKKIPNSFGEDFGWPRPGRIWSCLERDVFGRRKLEISGCRLR